jgi:Tfp pilus assembly protein PilF
LVTAAYLLARTLALKGFSHPQAHISWLTVVLTWPSLLLFYLKLLFWPVGLSPFYGLEYVEHPTLQNVLLPALVLFGVALGLWKWASCSRPVALAIPWLVFPILPVLNVQVFGNGNFAHNRYLYLPSVGFAILAAAALKKLGAGRKLVAGFPASQAAVAVGLALVMALAINLEDGYYASDAAFYSYAYGKMRNPDPVISMDYANTLAEQGSTERAAEIYRQVIAAQPGMGNAYFNLGYMYYQAGQPEPAAQYLAQAVARDPAQPGAAFYLGLADLKLNRLDEAEANVRHAVALAPAAPNYHFALGIVLKVKGNFPGALAEFKQELELNPAQQAAAQQIGEIEKSGAPAAGLRGHQ